MGALKKIPSEGGSGGKRGHSSMEHSVYTAEVKDAARTVRRQNDRTEVTSQIADADRSGPTRVRDGGSYLYLWADTVLVVCPNCGERAVVKRQRDSLFGPARLVCPSCALARTSSKQSTWGGPTDPWFQCDLWMQAHFRKHTVWAYNVRHAERLREYVAADLRERGPTPVCPGGDRAETMSMLEKLPSWFKVARNRPALIKILDELIVSAS